jgi:hypothetical protein
MKKAGPILAFAVAVAVGCGSEEGKAEDKPGKPDTPATPTNDKKETKHFRATITDASGQPPITITDVVLWVPEVSIFGGSGGTAERHLTVKRGALEVEVPFEQVLEIEVGKEKEDRLDIALKLNNPEWKDKELRGSVRSSLELRGDFEGSKLKATIKLREVKTVKIEEMPEGAKTPEPPKTPEPKRDK